MQQLWKCPECGVIVKVTEVLPPLVMDADKVIERKLLTCRINGLGKILQRFRLGLPFLRLGCWLADMELEVEETPEPLQPEMRRFQQPKQHEPTDAATLDDVNEDFRERRQAVLEDYAARLRDLDEWQLSEEIRLSNPEEVHGTMPLR